VPPTNCGRLIAVVGPTATGKSALGLDLAQHFDGEIIGADAMALYRGMDIGTAKTPKNLRRGVVHHQIDVLDVTEEASVAAYQRQARAAIDSVWSRGKAAIMVGGSGLYVRAALDLIDFPGTDPVIRRKWEELAAARGSDYLHGELAARDPAAARVIAPENTRRLVRALEVIELTGGPFIAQLPRPDSWRPVTYIGIDLPGEQLDHRINRRVDWMWQAGLVDEVVALERQGLRRGRTAPRAIGYAQCLALLDGEVGAAEARDGIGQATRQLARRQRKWFKRDSRINWLRAGPDVTRQAITWLSG